MACRAVGISDSVYRYKPGLRKLLNVIRLTVLASCLRSCGAGATDGGFEAITITINQGVILMTDKESSKLSDIQKSLMIYGFRIQRFFESIGIKSYNETIVSSFGKLLEHDPYDTEVDLSGEEAKISDSTLMIV